MTTFTITESNEIVAFATPKDAAANTATPFDSFSSQQEMDSLASNWPAERLVEIWNSLTGVVPVAKFKDRKTGVRRIWERIQKLGTNVEAEAAEPEKPKRQQKARAGALGAKGVSATAKSGKKASPAKKVPSSKKTAKPAKSESGPREGSKTAQVVEMLRRKNGATITEIMDKMGWQKHTVRGFMAGAMKKAGYEVESFKPEGGERTYRINK